MERYIAQMADKALTAMCGRESLTKRLRKAQMEFGFVSKDYFLRTAPEEVRQSIIAFMKCKTGRGSREPRQLLRLPSPLLL